MPVFSYKVDTSVALGAPALEAKLNSAGSAGWELIVALDDSSALLVYKSSSPQTFSYKVVNPPPLLQPPDIESFLQPYGAQGWELIDLSTQANVMIFKMAN